MSTATKIFEILLVEDSPDDIRLVTEALKETKITHNLKVMHDGDQAIEYLKSWKVNIQIRLPDVMILDLNMPKKGGHEVLSYMKDDPNLSHVPVVVLTVSQAEQDISKALGLRMNYYLNKPVRPEQLKALLTIISELWRDNEK
jgi:CheY-like chemotaxis protein